MAKLVLLSQGLTGRTHELKVDKTTIGRVDDNTLPIAESSISSHHCEILLKGADVLVRDLNSTNGTFINGEKITESVLKPGQILRLGQVEMRLETDEEATPPPAGKKTPDNTVVMQRGVSLTDLEAGAQRGFDTAGKGFTKKDNKVNRIFLIIAVVVGLIIIALIAIALMSATKPSP
jgi:pSer/pThr/pTyr-binding forkhead associated (FHA) protein